MKKFLMATAGLAALVGVSSQAQAVGISATYGMVGTPTLAPNPNDASTATSATFGTVINLAAGTGDMSAGSLVGLSFTTNSLDFTSLGGFTISNAAWGSYTSDLAGSSIVSQSASFINIFTVGTYTPGTDPSVSGFDVGPASLRITFTQACEAQNCTTTAAFSFASPPEQIPEPATLALLGAGLLGLGVARRRRA